MVKYLLLVIILLVIKILLLKLTQLICLKNFSLLITSNTHEGFSLKNLKKSKSPLFTTEDGVDIFEGDTYYVYQESKEVYKDGKNYHVNKIQKVKISNFPNTISDLHKGKSTVDLKEPTIKRFSTKEAAEEYIKAKTPLFTTEDGVDIFEGGKVYSIFKDYSSNTIFTKYLHDEHFGEDCELTYKNYYNFSTKEKAEEYILMNKPCLSINDILKTSSYNRDQLKELVKSKKTN